MLDTKHIYAKIAKEHDVHPDTVEAAARSQFEFVKKEIESGESKCIMLPLWGKFFVNRRKSRKNGKSKEVGQDLGTDDKG